MELSPILLCLLAAVPVLLLIILLVGCKMCIRDRNSTTG